MSTGSSNGYWFARLRRAGEGWTTREIYSHTEAQYWQLSRELKFMGYEVSELTYKTEWKPKAQVKAVALQMELLRNVVRTMTAGVKPGAALTGVIDSTTDNRALRARLQPARDILSQTGRVGDALRATGLFSPDVLAMTQAGEATSDLANAIKAALAWLEDRHTSLKAVKFGFTVVLLEMASSLAGLAAIALGGTEGAMSILGNMQVPNLEEVQKALELPILMNVVTFWLVAPLMLVGFSLLLTYRYAGAEERRKLDPLVQALPLVGPMVADSGFSVAFGVAGRVLQSGGRLPDAMRQGENAATVPAVQQYFQSVREKVSRGLDPSTALKSPQLTASEAVALSQIPSNHELGTVFTLFAEGRQERFRARLRKLLFACGVLTAFSMCVTTYVGVVTYSVVTKQAFQQLEDPTSAR